MYESFSTAALSRLADKLALEIVRASFSDRIEMAHYESQLHEVKTLLLDRLSNENDIFLATIRMEA
jgi:hypothetical protein